MDPDAEVIAEGCIWKKILIAGRSRISEKPCEGSTCVLKIENITSRGIDEDAKLSDLLDTLRKQHSKILTGESEVTLTIGCADCDIDRRIDRAVQLMKDDESARITVSMEDHVKNFESQFVTFDATLVKHNRNKPMWQWTPHEKYNVAMKHKNAGVKLYKDTENDGPRYREAFFRFSRATKILISLEPIDDLKLDKELYDNIQWLRSTLYGNMAACQTRQENYYHVIELCNKVLTRNDKDVLMLYRRGYAYGELKDYERAVQDFTALLSIEPDHRQARLKLQRYKSCVREANKHCNEMIKRMFRTNVDSSSR